MENEVVNVTEEIVETAVATGHKEVIFVGIGIAIGVTGTLGVISMRKKLKARKEAKELVVVDTEEDE